MVRYQFTFLVAKPQAMEMFDYIIVHTNEKWHLAICEKDDLLTNILYIYIFKKNTSAVFTLILLYPHSISVLWTKIYFNNMGTVSSIPISLSSSPVQRAVNSLDSPSRQLICSRAFTGFWGSLRKRILKETNKNDSVMKFQHHRASLVLCSHSLAVVLRWCDFIVNGVEERRRILYQIPV